MRLPSPNDVLRGIDSSGEHRYYELSVGTSAPAMGLVRAGSTVFVAEATFEVVATDDEFLDVVCSLFVGEPNEEWKSLGCAGVIVAKAELLTKRCSPATVITAFRDYETRSEDELLIVGACIDVGNAVTVDVQVGDANFTSYDTSTGRFLCVPTVLSASENPKVVVTQGR